MFMPPRPNGCARVAHMFAHGKQDGLSSWRLLTMLTTTIALLAAFTGPMQAGPAVGSDQRLLVADSAHTLFTPNAPDPGRAGQVYQLPQGGFGVTTRGTSHY